MPNIDFWNRLEITLSNRVAERKFSTVDFLVGHENFRQGASVGFFLARILCWMRNRSPRMSCWWNFHYSSYCNPGSTEDGFLRRRGIRAKSDLRIILQSFELRATEEIVWRGIWEEYYWGPTYWGTGELVGRAIWEKIRTEGGHFEAGDTVSQRGIRVRD